MDMYARRHILNEGAICCCKPCANDGVCVCVCRCELSALQKILYLQTENHLLMRQDAEGGASQKKMTNRVSQLRKVRVQRQGLIGKGAEGAIQKEGRTRGSRG